MTKIETHIYGIVGEQPLTKDALYEAYDKFRATYIKAPTQLRLSHESYQELRMITSEMFAKDLDKCMGMDIKVDYMQGWQVTNEETMYFADSTRYGR